MVAGRAESDWERGREREKEPAILNNVKWITLLPNFVQYFAKIEIFN